MARWLGFDLVCLLDFGWDDPLDGLLGYVLDSQLDSGLGSALGWLWDLRSVFVWDFE